MWGLFGAERHHSIIDSAEYEARVKYRPLVERPVVACDMHFCLSFPLLRRYFCTVDAMRPQSQLQ